MDRSFAQQGNYEKIVDHVGQIAVGRGLGREPKIINQGGAAMNACWVIEHAPAVYFKFPKPEHGGGSLWDYAATACLFGELPGAVASDIRGRPLDLNRRESTFMNADGIIYATDGALAGAVCDLFRLQ